MDQKPLTKLVSIALLLLLAALAGPVAGQTQIQITFPPGDGTVFLGQTVNVAVAVAPGVQGVGLLTENPLPEAKAGGSPTQFTVQVPADARPGPYRLTAIGSLSGSLIKSAPVTVHIERNEDPILIRVEPTFLQFLTGGEKLPLRVVGNYADGSRTVITESVRTHYHSANQAVATVSAQGLVTAVAPGKTNIDVTSANASYSIPVLVQAPSATSLLLNNGRFKVDVRWTTGSSTGDGIPVQLTPDTGYFWFFNPSNVELVIKVLNGCGLGGHYWVFAGGLTNVKTTTLVTDTHTGATKTYNTPAGPPFAPIQDTSAFATCP